MERDANYKNAIRVSLVTILLNAALSILKLVAGLIGHSVALVSDAVDSASDVLITGIVIVGLRAASKASDEEHRYGHERMECIAAIVLAAILFVVGGNIGYTGIGHIISGDYLNSPAPTWLPLAAALVSAAVKEGMYHYKKAAAKRERSSALMADAKNHRADALLSLGAFAGALGARLGVPVLDPIASLVICIFILKAAVEVLLDAISKLTDRSCPEETIQAMRQLVLSEPAVQGLDDIKTRMFGSRVYVDVEIAVDGDLPLRDAHAIAERVHGDIEQNFPDVKHCMVHVNPYQEPAGDGPEE